MASLHHIQFVSRYLTNVYCCNLQTLNAGYNFFLNALSRRPVTQKAQVRFRASTCGIYSRWGGTRNGSSPSTYVPPPLPPQDHSIPDPYLYFMFLSLTLYNLWNWERRYIKHFPLQRLATGPEDLMPSSTTWQWRRSSGWSVQFLPSPPISFITNQHFHSSDVSEIPVHVCKAASYHQNSARIYNLNYRPILINSIEFTSTILQRKLFVSLLRYIPHINLTASLTDQIVHSII
jgi:hypothetical protein